MLPSQLRQWSFQNSQPDQWWLCLDSVTEEIPVTVAVIEERLKSGDYSAAQALHVSQAGMTNPSWIDLTMPATIKPPIVANADFLAPGAPLPSGAMLNQVAVSQPSSLRETIGIVGLILAVCLLLFSLRNMPYILIFILAWIIASVLILKSKQSCVLTFGGGLIAAAIALLLAAKILPNLGSDSGSSATRHRVEQSDTVSSNISSTKEWYQGGTLSSHGATMRKWHRASYEDRLASSSDFIARMLGGDMGNLSMDGDIKPMAARLEMEISAAYQEGVTDTLPVTDIATGCILILKAHGVRGFAR